VLSAAARSTTQSSHILVALLHVSVGARESERERRERGRERETERQRERDRVRETERENPPAPRSCERISGGSRERERERETCIDVFERKNCSEEGLDGRDVSGNTQPSVVSEPRIGYSPPPFFLS
jgi:hypothetical protein